MDEKECTLDSATCNYKLLRNSTSQLSIQPASSRIGDTGESKQSTVQKAISNRNVQEWKLDAVTSRKDELEKELGSILERVNSLIVDSRNCYQTEDLGANCSDMKSGNTTEVICDRVPLQPYSSNLSFSDYPASPELSRFSSPLPAHKAPSQTQDKENIGQENTKNIFKGCTKDESRLSYISKPCFKSEAVAPLAQLSLRQGPSKLPEFKSSSVKQPKPLLAPVKMEQVLDVSPLNTSFESEFSQQIEDCKRLLVHKYELCVPDKPKPSTLEESPHCTSRHHRKELNISRIEALSLHGHLPKAVAAQRICQISSEIHEENPTRGTAMGKSRVDKLVEGKKQHEQSCSLEFSGPMAEIKLEEVGSRLKFIVKKDIGCLDILVRLIGEVVASDPGTVRLIKGCNPESNAAYDKLTLAIKRANVIKEEYSTSQEELKAISGVLIKGLKEAAHSLYMGLRRENSILEAEKPVQASERSSITQKPVIHHRNKQVQERGTQVSLKESPSNISKSVSTHNLTQICSSDRVDKNSLALTPLREPLREDLPGQLTTQAEHRMSLKVCSMAKMRNNLIVAYEDGTANLVSLSVDGTVGFEKCFRISTEPITQTVTVEEKFGHVSDLLYVSAGLRDPNILVWDMKQQKEIGKMVGHTQTITRLVMISSLLLVSCSIDKTVRIWNTAETKIAATLYDHDSAVLSCAYSEEFKMVVTGDLNGLIVLHSLDLDEERYRACETNRVIRGSGPILELCFDPYKRILSYEGSKLKVYDIRGTVLKQIVWHLHPVLIRFVSSSTLLCVDITGLAVALDYEEILESKGGLTPIHNSDYEPIELATKTIAQRLNGTRPIPQIRMVKDRLSVISVCKDLANLKVSCTL